MRRWPGLIKRISDTKQKFVFVLPVFSAEGALDFPVLE